MWLLIVKPTLASDISVIVNVQAPIPLQPEAEPLPPIQPAKVEPVPGWGLRVTAVFPARLRSAPLLLAPFQAQSIPFPVTWPLPVPDGMTVSR